jgi:hypothetical protein
MTEVFGQPQHVLLSTDISYVESTCDKAHVLWTEPATF